MGLRNIMVEGDNVLRKRSREVTVVDDRIRMILDDMLETMRENDEGDVFEIINPEIIEIEGSFIGEEGCLSVPGIFGKVERPERIKVKGLDRYGKELICEATDLKAVAICHEFDHLEGVL